MKNNIFRPKFFSILKQGYDKKQLSKDVFAGIIVGVVALPLAIAFAVASGVSPEKGIVTAIIAGFIISFLGGSRVQIGGPTGAFIVIVFGTAFLRFGRELKPGHVLTNEPGIYFIPELIDLWQKDKKFEEFINYSKVNEYRNFGGIRLEDDILITETGNRILGSKRIPISIEEVEHTMLS
jgi:hypothetical protein